MSTWHRPLLPIFLSLVLATPLAALEMMVGGIQVNEPDHVQWMRALRREKLNTVAVTVYAKQGDWDSENLWWDEDDEGVRSEIRTARRHGLRVALILRVALDHAFDRNEFLWHGMIQPRSEQQLDAWFERYRRFVLRWALFAQREGVDLLGVGSEMNALASTRRAEAIPALEAWYLDEAKQDSHRARVLGHGGEIEDKHMWQQGREAYDSLPVFLDARTAVQGAWARQVAHLEAPDPVIAINRRRALLQAHWERVIRIARRVFEGGLTYAANFDQYQEVGFWSELDVMGINAYFPLRSSEEGRASLYPALRSGWGGVIDELERFRGEIGLEGQPVVFTELGYTWRRDSTVEPWNGFGFSVLGEEDTQLMVWSELEEDRAERAVAVRALHDELMERRARWFRGILWWKLSTIPEHRRIEPFVLTIERGTDDPLLPELRRFLHPWWQATAASE